MNTSPPLSQPFEQDSGTRWLPGDNRHQTIEDYKRAGRNWRRTLVSEAGGRPFVWFVDDEKRNRDCFVYNHRLHFALITFGSREAVRQALDDKVPCDAVVTDIFFPAQQPQSNADNSRLLSIYDKINATKVSHLGKLWNDVKNDWRLSGFDIARDVTDYAIKHKEHIPVLLFSRKATLLLSQSDWIDEPSALVENTAWMIEKVSRISLVTMRERRPRFSEVAYAQPFGGGMSQCPRGDGG